MPGNMLDSRSMKTTVISKLAEVDPTFVQMVKSLYGADTDPRQLWDLVKAMPDTSAVHVPSTGAKSTKANNAKEHRLAATGLAATGVALVGGGHAVKTTIAEHRGSLKPAGKISTKIGTKLALSPKKVALVGTGGWLGLHGVELLGDSLAMRAQKRNFDNSKPVAKRVVHRDKEIERSNKLDLPEPVVPNIPESVHPKPDAEGIKGTLKAMGHKKDSKGTEFAVQAATLGVGVAAAHELLKKPEKTTTAPTKPLVALGKANMRAIVPALNAEQLAANTRTAKRSQKVLLAGVVGGSAAGGYAGAKKFSLKQIPKPPSMPHPKTMKKNAEVDFTWEGTISKVDTDKRLVFGFCSLSKINGEEVVDLQGDYIPIEETETSAYRYVIESRVGGDMHQRVNKAEGPLHTADLVESMVFTPEKLEKLGLAPDAVPHGWWIGMKVNDDEQWANVKAGKRLGFSIHGKGRRVEKALS